MIENYFSEILKKFKTGDTTEGSFYFVLENFIEALAKKQGFANIEITQQQKRLLAGIPDFTIRRGRELIGYIEAKDLGVKLEDAENTEQIKKYKNEFDNFIFTNYFEFWLWRRKEQKWIFKVNTSVGEIVSMKAGQIPVIKNEKEFSNLVETFFRFSIPERKTAKSLAMELAIKTKLIPPFVVEELKNNQETKIDEIYRSFQEFLIPNLSPEDFADIYAQTITHGLFTARLRYTEKEPFNRFLAQKFLPKGLKILSETFSLISGYDLPESIAWIVDDISTILAYADIENIKQELKRRKGDDDPMIHFYETFLAEYDPKSRKARGVYYTPFAVVSYITRSINILLKEKFDKKQGFASDGVTILDPASGTLTFPANSIAIAKKEAEQSNNPGSWLKIVKDKILQNFYAFELLMAPYVIGHLKISLLLEELGYKMETDDRFKLYLTNTLDLSEIKETKQFFSAELSEEAKLAKEVKEKIPILAIMGNPPYSGSSVNKQKWILDKIDDYKNIEGISLGERNPKWIQDDYVKFFRFAQWKIDQAGIGVLGFITNHAWIDNPTFRGMRYSLLKTFNEIYILNLHGSMIKKETAGGDENVFDIKAGVAITICVKHNKTKDKKVFYADIYGKREKKYDWLLKNDISSTKWQKIIPSEPYYFFCPKEEKGFDVYQNFSKITDIFPTNSVGVVTARDNFVIDFEKDPLERKIRAFRDSKEADDFMKQNYQLRDKIDFIKNARKKLRETDNWESYLTKILYRPFDERWIFYNDILIERSRRKVMQNMLKPNLALLVKRQNKQDFSYIFISDKLTESCVFESAYANNTVLPLYIYDEEETKNLVAGQEKLNLKGVQHSLRIKDEKTANIDKDFYKKLEAGLGKKLSPEDIFYYIYGVLYSNIYRKKYQEFLKIDFPKIPFTKNRELFNKIADLGEELINLHLLKSQKLNKPSSKFPVSTANILTDGKVEKREYNLKEKRIYINEKQYFEKLEPEIWNYQIGGYQVLDKWLKDRVGRVLSVEDVNHYLKIIAVIKDTIDLQKEIDKLYPEIEKNLIEKLKL